MVLLKKYFESGFSMSWEIEFKIYQIFEESLKIKTQVFPQNSPWILIIIKQLDYELEISMRW